MGTTTQTKMPHFLRGPMRDALGDMRDWLKSGDNYTYGSKKGEDLFTPMNNLQKQYMGNTGWLGRQDIGKTFGLNKAGNLWDQYKSADMFKGEIGNVDDYMDPYLKGVLNPAIREIQQESDRQQNAIGAAATSAGAFGDARHGISDVGNMEMTNQAIADTTGRVYSDAFNNAQGQRNLAIERLGTAATGIEGLGNNLYGKMGDINDRLMDAGNYGYNFEEKRRQTMQNFQEALKNKDYDDAMKLLAAISGSPRDSTTTTESDTGMWGVLGSLLGGIF